MPAKIGFLTVRRQLEHGYFGGYLVVNELARPLEFQCTLPIQPSRAQVVLYGPTIEDFVCGEQIAKSLISKGKLKPDLILTDSMPALAASLVCESPIAMLVQSNQEAHRNASLMNLPEHSMLQVAPFKVGAYHFLMPAERGGLEATAQRVVDQLCEQFELSEPFQRIVDALIEAHPSTNANAA